MLSLLAACIILYLYLLIVKLYFYCAVCSCLTRFGYATTQLMPQSSLTFEALPKDCIILPLGLLSQISRQLGFLVMRKQSTV